MVYSAVHVCPKCQLLRSGAKKQKKEEQELEAKLSGLNFPDYDDMKITNSLKSGDRPLKKHLQDGDFYNKR